MWVANTTLRDTDMTITRGGFADTFSSRQVFSVLQFSRPCQRRDCLILESTLVSPEATAFHPYSSPPALHPSTCPWTSLSPESARAAFGSQSVLRLLKARLLPWLNQTFLPPAPSIRPINTPAGINPFMCLCCPVSDCCARVIVVVGDSWCVWSSTLFTLFPWEICLFQG